MRSLLAIGFLFAFAGGLSIAAAQEALPVPRPADAAQSVVFPGPELQKRLAGLKGGQNFLVVVLTPGGVDATLTESAKFFSSVARGDSSMVSADEAKPDESALYVELVQGLRVVDFPYTVVFSKEGVPLLGMAAGAQSGDDAARMVAKWVAEGGEVMRLQAAVAAAEAEAKGPLLAQLIAAQGVGFAASVQPDLPAKLRQAPLSGAKELDVIRAEVDDYVSKREFQELYDSAMDSLAEATGKGDLEGCLAIIGKLITERKPAALTVQRLELQRFRMCVNARAFDRALEYLAIAEAASPGSPLASRIPKFRSRVEAAKAKAAAEPKPAAGEAPKPAAVPDAPAATPSGAP